MSKIHQSKILLVRFARIKFVLFMMSLTVQVSVIFLEPQLFE